MRLAVIDPHGVPDEQLLGLLSAEWRQLAYQQARVWQTMAEIGVRDPMPNLPGGARWSTARVFDNGVDEIRAELLLTRRSAGDELANACGVAGVRRVMQALSDGVIDRCRAIEFAEGCIELTEAQTEALLDELLPTAAAVTATELKEKIKQVAIALDPGWAQRRYSLAVREQKVVGYLNQDGSATVSGQNLPADEAAMACARVDALADAAKRAGAKAKIDHLRAQLFLGLLDGRFHGMTEPAIIAELLRQFPKPAEQVDEPAPESPAESRAPDDPNAEPDAEEPAWGLLTVPISRGWRLERRDERSFITISPRGRRRVVCLEPVTPPLAARSWREQLGDPDPPPY